MSGGVGPAPPSLALASPFASLRVWPGRWLVPIHHQFHHPGHKTYAGTSAVSRFSDSIRGTTFDSRHFEGLHHLNTLRSALLLLLVGTPLSRDVTRDCNVTNLQF